MSIAVNSTYSSIFYSIVRYVFLTYPLTLQSNKINKIHFGCCPMLFLKIRRGLKAVERFILNFTTNEIVS